MDNRDNHGGVVGVVLGAGMAVLTVVSAVYCLLYEVPWARIVDIMVSAETAWIIALVCALAAAEAWLNKPRPKNPRPDLFRDEDFR